MKYFVAICSIFSCNNPAGRGCTERRIESLAVALWASTVVGGGGGAAARRLGVPGGEERCVTGVYGDLPCAPMGAPRVWAIKRDHGLPLGE